MNNPLIAAELLKPDGVAARLTRARTGANLQGKELAHRAGWRATKVSKLELGQQMPTANDIHTWLRVCGLDGKAVRETVELLDEIRHAYPELQRLHRASSRDDPDLGSPAPNAYRQGFADGFREAMNVLAAHAMARQIGQPNQSGDTLSPQGQASI